jgi:hypothetical protein
MGMPTPFVIVGKHGAQNTKHKPLAVVGLRSAVVGLAFGWAAAGAWAVPPDTYGEKSVWDPQTREWVVEPEPEPGTDVGDWPTETLGTLRDSSRRGSNTTAPRPRCTRRPCFSSGGRSSSSATT